MANPQLPLKLHHKRTTLITTSYVPIACVTGAHKWVQKRDSVYLYMAGSLCRLHFRLGCPSQNFHNTSVIYICSDPVDL